MEMSDDAENDSIVTTTTIHKKRKLNVMDNFVSVDDDTCINLKHKHKRPNNQQQQPQHNNNHNRNNR